MYGMSHAMTRAGFIDDTEKRSGVPRALNTHNAVLRALAKSNKLHSNAKADAVDSKMSQRVKDLSHIKDLKSQNYSSDFELPPYCGPSTFERTGLCARNRLNASLRDHSNAVALVGKSAPTKQSNLQISRIPIASVATAAIAYQFTTLLVLDVATDFAAVQLPHGIRDPNANGAFTGRDVRALSDGRDTLTFVMAHSANELLEHTPRFLCPWSFLERTRALCRAELETSEISRVVTQTTDHLRYTCSRVATVEEASDGSCTWFAFSLIIYMAADVRLHPVLERRGFSEYDLAISHAMLNYARQLVGNRSRESMSKLKRVDTETAKRKLNATDQLWKVSSERFVQGTDDDAMDEELMLSNCGDSCPTDDESLAPPSETSGTSGPSTAMLSPCFPKTIDIVNLADVADATRIMCIQELARKARRIDSEPPVSYSGIGCDQTGFELQTTTTKSRSDNTSAMGGAPKVKAILEFLHLHFLQDNGFLTHLYADTPEASQNASLRVIEWQLKSKNINPELRNPFTMMLLSAGRACADQTRSNLRPLIEQATCESPSIVSWSEATSDESTVVYTGLVRRLNVGAGGSMVGGTRLLVCSAPTVAQPLQPAKSTVVWSAVSTTSLSDDRCVSSNGIIETFRLKKLIEASECQIDSAVRGRSLQTKIRQTCTELMAPGVTGVTRSVIVYDACIPVNTAVLSTAFAVSNDLVKRHLEAQRVHDFMGVGAHKNKAMYSCTSVQDVATPASLSIDMPMPVVTPSSVFAIGTYLLECTRTAYNQIAPKQSLLAVPIAPESIPKSLESFDIKTTNPKMRPWCFLNVNDIKFQLRRPRELFDRVRAVETDPDNEPPPTHVRRVATHVTVTVCGDRALDVPTALRLLSEASAAGCVAHDVAGRVSVLRQWRSVCYTTGIQCCTFHQFSNSVASREMNTKIEGTNKIEAPDNHYLAFPTIYQAYVVGHTNLPTMFEGTPWCDTYGSGYECGAIASMGINGRSCVSDFRNAAFSLMDQKQVDRLCVKIGSRAIVACADGKSHLAVPMAYLGGLPRAMIPGVHLALNGLVAAFDLLEGATSPEENTEPQTRSSIQILPFSPFTQAISPVVSAASNGMDFRDNAWKATGKGVADACPSTEHPRPLRTLRQDSILNSDLINSVAVKLISARTDNMFETIEPAIAPVLVFASQLAEIATKLAYDSTIVSYESLKVDDCLECLRRECCAFFNAAEGCYDECAAVLVVDALVLFNCMFPLEFEVGKPCLLKALESAPNAALTFPCRRFADLALQDASDADRAALQHFASRIFDATVDGPWTVICGFLGMVSKHGRTFDNSAAELKSCARCVALLAHAVWLVHSDDGKAPPKRWSPLHCRASPDKVEGPDLCCVWVDRPDNCQLNRRTQRGAVIGLPNAGPQQILMLLTGAAMDGIRVQYIRNEGNMCLRMSSCALKDAEGAKLSAKSTSPIYSDNDAETFGTIVAKEAQARRQVVAWRANNDLIFDVSTRFCEPRAKKFAGADFVHKEVAKRLAEWTSQNRVSSQQCAGETMMANAIDSMGKSSAAE